jgi:LacI family transcriptional regulator
MEAGATLRGPRGETHTVVSRREVAQRADVAPSHVSNYFNRPELVSEKAKQRIAAAVAELGYVPNGIAAELKSGRSAVLGLVVLDAWIPYFTELSRGFERTAEAGGYSVVLFNSGRSAQREEAHLDFLAARRVAGVAVVPQADVSSRLERWRQDAGMAVAVLDDPRRVSADVPTVSLDDELGGRLAGEHALARGARHIAFLGACPVNHQVMDRLTGVRAAAEGRGTPLDILETPDVTMADGVDAASRALTASGTRPQALVCSNDLVALGALQVCLKEGLSVPEDIEVIGYDDIAFASQAAVPLSTVRQPAAEMGAAAAELLLMQLRGERRPADQRFEPELMVRESTG